MSGNDVPQEQYSVFGRYINFFFLVLRTHQAEVAREIHISPSTISKAMKSTKRVEEETVLQIWKAFVAIAERRGMVRLFDVTLQESFFNSAHCTTEQQVSLSEQRLEALLVLLERRSHLSGRE